MSYRPVRPGTILEHSSSTLPAGHLWADGSAVSRTTYARLFNHIGTSFGAGDGSTTFNIPDKRGRVAVGKDDMGGSAASRMTSGGSGIAGATLGAAGGEEIHTLSVGEMPNHSHGAVGGGYFFVQGTGGNYSGGGNTVGLPTSTAATGGGGAHNNTQPSIVVNFIVKT